MTRLFALIGLLTGIAFPAAAQEGCQATPHVSLPLLMQASRVLVEIKVNDQPALFALDTGAISSVVSTDLVKRLGLPTVTSRVLGFRDIGGGGTEKFAHNALVSLGGRHVTSNYIRWRGFAVADLSSDGLLGNDLLRGFDVDLDFAAGRMALFARGACNGVPPGPGPSASHSMAALGWSAFGRLSRIRVPVRLDGKRFWAVLDTGAARSYFAAGVALSEFGLDIGKMNPGRARGAYGGVLSVAPHEFRALEIGDISLPSPRLSLTAPDGGFEDAPILLGLEQLRHLRLFVAYGARRVYISPARPSG